MDKELNAISQAYFDNQLLIQLKIDRFSTNILDKSYGLLSKTFIKTTYPFYLTTVITSSKDSTYNLNSMKYTTFTLLDIIAIFFPVIANKYKYDYFTSNNCKQNDIIYELKNQEQDFFDFYCYQCEYKTILKPFALKQFNLYITVTDDCNNDNAYYLLTDSIQENDALAGIFAKYKLLELDQKWSQKLHV